MTYQRRRPTFSPADSAARRYELRTPAGPPTLERVAHHENLLAAFHDLKAKGGGPGPDGVTFAGIGRRDAPVLARNLSARILAGTYRPGPTRLVRVPKASGGYREIQVGNVCDRVAAAALNRIMTPLWAKVLGLCSYGRAGRGVDLLLAELAARMTARGLYVVAADDVKGAFDHVVIGQVLDDHRRRVDDPALVGLVGTILRGQDPTHNVGIPQGCPYSPAALDARLHAAHDAPFAGAFRDELSLFRYVDNLVIPCKDMQKAHQALGVSRLLLADAGLTLKGQDGDPADIREGGVVHVLGFTLGIVDGVPKFGTGRSAVDGLTESLDEAHRTHNPPQAASLAVRGWLASQGPAFETQRISDTIDSVFDVSARQGFRELGSRKDLRLWAKDARRRWKACRKAAEHRENVRTRTPKVTRLIRVGAPPPTVSARGTSPPV